MLVTHMAGLTEANEIGPRVRLVRGFKEPKRLDVVDRKALANMLAAVGAVTALICNNSRAGIWPTSAAIGARSTNPIRRVFTLWFCRTSASGGAKSGNSILLCQPRLLVESRAAIIAPQRKAVLPPCVGATLYIFGSERIAGALANAKFVPDQVGLRACIEELLSLPARAARHATKACGFGPVWLNAKRRLADFTGFFNHYVTLRQMRTMGNGTTLVAHRRVEEAYRQPDLFVAPPSAPVQEGFDI